MVTDIAGGEETFQQKIAHVTFGILLGDPDHHGKWPAELRPWDGWPNYLGFWNSSFLPTVRQDKLRVCVCVHPSIPPATESST